MLPFSNERARPIVRTLGVGGLAVGGDSATDSARPKAELGDFQSEGAFRRTNRGWHERR